MAMLCDVTARLCHVWYRRGRVQSGDALVLHSILSLVNARRGIVQPRTPTGA